MTAKRWQSFTQYASWVFGKPTWETEERVPRLAVAAQLRDAAERAAARGDWETPLRDCLFAPSYPRADLTLRGQGEWLRSWLDSDAPALREAVAGFAATGSPPEERFAAWAQACEAAEGAGRVESRPDAQLAFGSLFNFAVDPERLPFVLQGPFGKLPPLLGSDPGPGYPAHLEFARSVARTLGESGIGRDMLDVQALILSAARNAAFWVSGAADEAAGVRADAPPHYLAVCAIYRDEASYMREWVEFHRLMGVERFFLYDNRSVDDHREVLAPYVERGEVVIHDWPMELGQRPAYDNCIAEHAAEARWIAFIDLDEFLFSPTGRPLPEVLAGHERWPGVGVNWAVFGSSGHATRPAGLVAESYTQRLETGENRSIKTIADPTRVVRCAGVHRFEYKSLGTVDENQYPIIGGHTKTESRARLQINHYMTKSLAEYEERSRRSRPNPYGPQNPDAFRRAFDPALLALREQAGARDEAILQYVPALKEALATPRR